LFAPAGRPFAEPATVDVDPPPPANKCGVTTLPVDPRLDARLAQPLAREGKRFTIRAIDPTVCR
jgi:hypothetical protein